MDNTKRLVILAVVSALTYGMLLGQAGPSAETPTSESTRIVFLRFRELKSPRLKLPRLRLMSKTKTVKTMQRAQNSNS